MPPLHVIKISAIHVAELPHHGGVEDEQDAHAVPQRGDGDEQRVRDAAQLMPPVKVEAHLPRSVPPHDATAWEVREVVLRLVRPNLGPKPARARAAPRRRARRDPHPIVFRGDVHRRHEEHGQPAELLAVEAPHRVRRRWGEALHLVDRSAVLVRDAARVARDDASRDVRRVVDALLP